MRTEAKHFIQQIIEKDLESGHTKRLITRFPPEPNGFLHIGHAKAICINFGLAQEYGGDCFLRLDDTNPEKEDEKYVESICDAVRWLGFQWKGEIRYASDYFEQFYDYAKKLIEQGNAYVCELNTDAVREYRGDLKNPGQNSPYRERPTQKNLQLLEAMRLGEYPEGTMTLRAKIDMSSPNLNLRDPTIYRIRHQKHYRTQSTWNIYPMYDFAHCLSDAIEGVTHSLCSLEFEDHRPLYDWFLDTLKIENPPKQIEFSRLHLEHTVTSKRQLTTLVHSDLVSGWDDPRMPTILAMKKRGYPPQAIQHFCKMIGVSKSEFHAPVEVLEDCIREKLDKNATRVMAVLNPLKVVITNYHQESEVLTAKKHPQLEELGIRSIPFSKEIYIEQSDFSENPPQGYRRLFLKGKVRLRYGYVIKCQEVIYSETGKVKELHCKYYPESKGGKPLSDGTKVKGIIHWVSITHAIPAQVNVYGYLLQSQIFDSHLSVIDQLNNQSLTTYQAYLEPSLLETNLEQSYQFERQGYFQIASNSSNMIFNQIVQLKTSWKKN